jgi:hypothetical protein
VVEKHDFRGIQRKIPQISDFCSKAWFEPSTPCWISGGHCKNVWAKFIAKIGFQRKTIFANFRKHPIFAVCMYTSKIGDFCVWVFGIFANYFLLL